MEIDQIELRRIIRDEIRAAANDWGLYYDTPERLEITRANFVLLNSFRIARESNQGRFARLFADTMSNFGGQALWVILAALCVLAWRMIKSVVIGQ